MGSFFHSTPLHLTSRIQLVTDPIKLAQVARDTLSYVEHAETFAPEMVKPERFDTEFFQQHE